MTNNIYVDEAVDIVASLLFSPVSTQLIEDFKLFFGIKLIMEINEYGSTFISFKEGMDEKVSEVLKLIDFEINETFDLEIKLSFDYMIVNNFSKSK